MIYLNNKEIEKAIFLAKHMTQYEVSDTTNESCSRASDEIIKIIFSIPHSLYLENLIKLKNVCELLTKKDNKDRILNVLNEKIKMLSTKKTPTEGVSAVTSEIKQLRSQIFF